MESLAPLTLASCLDHLRSLKELGKIIILSCTKVYSAFFGNLIQQTYFLLEALISNMIETKGGYIV